MPEGGRNIGIVSLDDTAALALAKHWLARYFNAGVATDRPTKGRRAGEAYFSKDTHELSVWDGSDWIPQELGGGGDDMASLFYAVAFGRLNG